MGLYVVLGWLGLYGIAIPLFGYLSYIGALLFPLVVVIEVVGAVLALTKRGRWAWVYLLGKISVLTINLILLGGVLVGVLLHLQPGSEVKAPLYLSLISL